MWKNIYMVLKLPQELERKVVKEYYSYIKLENLLVCREILHTLLWRRTKLWPRMELMLFALTLGVLCPGIQQRTSSSAPVMDPDTMTKDELLEDLHLW